MLLRIEPVRVDRDRATYECVAENGVGDAVSAEAVLTVYEGKTLKNFFLVLFEVRFTSLKVVRLTVNDRTCDFAQNTGKEVKQGFFSLYSY